MSWLFDWRKEFERMASRPSVSDRDRDGIPDWLDDLPLTPSITARWGRTDTDGDGVPDYRDTTPTLPDQRDYIDWLPKEKRKPWLW